EIKGIDKRHEKIVILLMASCNISHFGTSRPVLADALQNEQIFVEKNASRILGALEEIALIRGYSQAARMCMTLHKRLEHKMWYGSEVLAQNFFTMTVSAMRAVSDTTLELQLIMRPNLEACELHGAGTWWLILLEDVTGRHSLFS
ncbi:hypothetical protein DUNSADRAFT_7517, partial [Dunaliella salina]